MKKAIVLIGICFLVFASKAQIENYDDVAVIVNSNSDESIEIGNYFKNKRNIPEVNMVYINCSTEERVDSAGLFSIVDQVGNYLLSSGIFQSVNYLVTTKGIPLIFEGGNCDSIPSSLKCSSIDSELTLVINHEEYIGSSSSFQNPYFENSNYNFSQNEFGLYLVTRLDGYTVGDVKALIDRSGPDLKINKNDAQFIFDLAFATDTNGIIPLVNVMQQGNTLVESKSWKSIYSPDPEIFITNESNVLGYFSYLYQPSNKTLSYEWFNGSIAFQGIGETAFTFLEEENIYNDLILANIIEEGVCGAAGTVVPYFLSQGTIWPEILFDKYTYGVELISESNPYFNLAESYYQALKVTSSAHVIVGDPKTSIVLDTIIEGVTNTLEAEKDAFVWEVYENGNFGASEEFTIMAWTANSTPILRRCFIDFNFSAIPSNATINSATLVLFNDSTSSSTNGEHSQASGANEIIIQRVVDPWNEMEVTWDNQPGVSNQHEILVPPNTSPHQDYSIDVTPLIRDIVKYPESSFGFRLKLLTEEVYRSVIFASSNHIDTSLHPEIKVCWSIDSTNSIDPEQSQLSFEVYPNPNQGVFNLMLPDNNLAAYQISVFNSLGQRITNYHYGMGQVQLYGKGIFVLLLSDNDGNYSGKKVIVH